MKVLLFNADQIVTFCGKSALKGARMDCPLVIEHGCVLTEDGIITAVFPVSSQKYFDTTNAKIFDCSGKTLTAGLIDCHTHFVYYGDRANELNMRLNGATYSEIMAAGGGIINTVDAVRAASVEELTDVAAKRLDTYLSYGVTSVESKSGYGLDLDNEVKQLQVMRTLQQSHPVDVIPTYMGAHATPREMEPNEYIDYVCDNVLPIVAKEKLADFVDIFIEKNVFDVTQAKKLFDTATKLGMRLKAHVDEINDIGGSPYAIKSNATSIEHLLKISDQSIALLSQSNTVGVVLPLTAFCLGEPYAPARKMIDNDCAIAIATDYNPGSCPSQSIPMLIALSVFQMKLSLSETLCALTLNAAAAIGKCDSIGSIEVGKRANIAIFDTSRFNQISYGFGDNHIEYVMIDGKIYDKNKGEI